LKLSVSAKVFFFSGSFEFLFGRLKHFYGKFRFFGWFLFKFLFGRLKPHIVRPICRYQNCLNSSLAD